MSFKEKLRFFWTYAKNYQHILIILGIFAIISAAANAFVPFLFGQMLDVALSGKNFYHLTYWQIAIIWLTITLFSIFVNALENNQAVLSVNKIEKDFIIDVCRHALHLPVSYHNDCKPGEVQKFIDRGVEANNSLVETIYLILAPNLLTLVVAFFVMFAINWILSSIMFVTVILFLLFSLYYQMDKILANQKAINEEYNKLYGHIGDMMSQILVVKTNTAENLEQQGQEKYYRAIYKRLHAQMSLWLKMGIIQGLLINLSRILIVVLAIYLALQKQLSIGEVTMFIGYLALVFAPLQMVANNIRVLRRRLVDLEDTVSLRKENPELDQAEADEVVLNGGIEFQKVNFQYPERPEGLFDISFRIEPGQTVAFFGATGSGKTTITNLLLRLYQPDNGAILLDGRDSRLITIQSLRQQMAVVPQDLSLFNESIFYNITYGCPQATLKKVIEAAKIANIHDFIESLPQKYETVVGERGIKLSGGQVQRIIIARAALRDPKILILDEATKSLDQKTKFDVLQALKNVIENRTTVIITHDFSAISRSADKIFVLDNGRIAQVGNHQDLIAQPGQYQTLWENHLKHLLSHPEDEV